MDRWYNHICGVYCLVPAPGHFAPSRQYLPQLTLSAHTKIVSSASRTTLTQTFLNPKPEPIPELRYTFPLRDGVSVVGFVCTINGDRIIRGVVKEREEAKRTFQAAVDRGETAGLLEQLPEASDVFTTTVGNVPAKATIKIDITYLEELRHDAELDGVRFTIPTHIAPRYGSYPGQLLRSSDVDSSAGIRIVVDVEMPNGSNIKSVQSPSHPIAVTLGNTSTGASSGADMSLQKASATLALNTMELDKDFVLLVAANTGNPSAVLETHPTIPNHRALMATLVPKFSLPSSRPEIVFLCDRSGSMGQGNKIPNLKSALHLFLKSLPVGVKLNICSFGTSHEFLFPDGSRPYDAFTLEEATRYVNTFAANFGGTEILRSLKDVFGKRYRDMDLEVFLLTDGDVWNQNAVFRLVNEQVAESKGTIRVFSLGIGGDASHALVEGVAAAGNGFAQFVGEHENMNSKVVRMLKAALTPHVSDYTLEIKYGKEPEVDTNASTGSSDDDFEIVEKAMDALALDVQNPGQTPEQKEAPPKKPISLFDENVDLDMEMADASAAAGGRYSHVPPVPEPKLLQAPFVIPALYPFSRTTVYLLLSPDTAQKQPKSVVLRGTSLHGPLELEIPVTVLSERGETIHQLAARKAVKELEEGRGWIYHARDATQSPSPLLKDRYPGLFSDMVEREAVRLGVTYQVGGKWCSFVAIDPNDEGATKTPISSGFQFEKDSRIPPGSSSAPFQHGIQQSVPTSSLFGGAPQVLAQQPQQPSLFGASLSQGRTPQGFMSKPAVPTSSLFGSSAKQGFVQQQHSNLFGAPPPPRATPQGFMSKQPAVPTASFFGSGAPQDSIQQQQRQNPSLFGLMSKSHSAAAPAPPPPPPAAGAASRTSALFSLGMSQPAARRAPPVARNDLLDLELGREHAPGATVLDGAVEGDNNNNAQKADQHRPATASSSASASASEGDKLAQLVALQTFTGAWRWDEGLLELLGFQRPKFVAARAAAADLVGASDRLATALVLAFLELRLADRRDEWEMLADKAREWLDEDLRNGGVFTLEVYCEKARTLLLCGDGSMLK